MHNITRACYKAYWWYATRGTLMLMVQWMLLAARAVWCTARAATYALCHQHVQRTTPQAQASTVHIACHVVLVLCVAT